MFGVGPAGTGKTYLAMAQAVAYLLAKRVTRIILARPAVEAGEKLGFLPGDLQEKVNPYLRPLYDALYDMLEPERVERLLERGVIEVAPIAFMRGRTLNDAFVILDEAQNTTSEQMKMFLTRLGFGSKAVVTGDITQIDLPAGRVSGLVEALKVVAGVEGIATVQFDDRDVVRHALVQQIVKAYESYTSAPTRAYDAARPGGLSVFVSDVTDARGRRLSGPAGPVSAGGCRARAPRHARRASTIALVTDAHARLNRPVSGRRQGHGRAVFPGGRAAGRSRGPRPRPSLGGRFLGDIAIARGVAARQARAQGHPLASNCAFWPSTASCTCWATITRGTGRDGQARGRLRRRAALPAGLIGAAGLAVIPAHA